MKNQKISINLYDRIKETEKEASVLGRYFSDDFNYEFHYSYVKDEKLKKEFNEKRALALFLDEHPLGSVVDEKVLENYTENSDFEFCKSVELYHPSTQKYIGKRYILSTFDCSIHLMIECDENGKGVVK